MFKKLITNVSFSPALVGQLGFYAKRLKKEEATRQLGLVFTSLALVVQSFAVLTPPEAANAASSNDMVRGGVKNVSEFLRYYDRNSANLKDTMNALGITRSEIAAAKKTTINGGSKANTYLSWGNNAKFSSAQGERKYSVPTNSGGTHDVYARPMKLWGTYNRDVMTGYSKKVGWFAIMNNCGNLVTKTYPPLQKCPNGTKGVYPNCRKKKQCPTGTSGTYPDCNPNPVAACDVLEITKSGSIYTFAARAEADNGAKISAYSYTISRDGKELDTVTNKSNKPTDSLTFEPSAPGKHTVKLSVTTSLGTKTSSDCVKMFTVAPPNKCDYNTDLLASNPACQPCPGDENIWLKDPSCEAKLVQTKTAKNITQDGIDATTATAIANDRIEYKLSASNTGTQSTNVRFDEQLIDVAEYASILDEGGGQYDKDKHVLSWPSVTLGPGETQTRLFTVKLASSIPAAAQGISDPDSYDCEMVNTYGNSTNVAVNCPAPKQVEQVVAELPKTGTTENMLFAGGLFAVVAYFYARSRQLKKEVRLIRRDLNTGTI